MICDSRNINNLLFLVVRDAELRFAMDRLKLETDKNKLEYFRDKCSILQAENDELRDENIKLNQLLRLKNRDRDKCNVIDCADSTKIENIDENSIEINHTNSVIKINTDVNISDLLADLVNETYPECVEQTNVKLNSSTLSPQFVAYINGDIATENDSKKNQSNEMHTAHDGNAIELKTIKNHGNLIIQQNLDVICISDEDDDDVKLISENINNNNSTPTPDDNRVNSVQPLYVCGFRGCEENFHLKIALVQHKKIHYSKKEYHCSKCDRAYFHLKHLKRHLRINHGEDKRKKHVKSEIKPCQCTNQPVSKVNTQNEPCTIRRFNKKNKIAIISNGKCKRLSYRCHFGRCSERFCTKGELSQHRASHKL